jgi:hypothetical protein
MTDIASRLEAAGVRVLPLVWQEPCQANYYCHIAKSVFGDYYVNIDGGRHCAFLEANEKPYERRIGDDVGSLYEAKAAAEAHHIAAFLAQLGVVE